MVDKDTPRLPALDVAETDRDYTVKMDLPGVNKDDVHVAVGAPSLTVIPPPAIHTSTWSAPGENHLVDVFSPPRLDFSTHAGWVLNEAEYPLPPGVVK